MAAMKMAVPSIQAALIINFILRAGGARTNQRSRIALTVGALMGVCQQHVENDGEDGADQQHLDHEVVHGLLEDQEEGLHLQRLAVVVSERGGAVLEVEARETLLGVRLEQLQDVLHA